MKRCVYLSICAISLAVLPGCRQKDVLVVTQYGPDFMTYRGPTEAFNDACRSVLHELSYKEKTGENSVSYPYYGEGVSSHKEGDTPIAVRAYLKTKGEDEAEYTITTVILGRRDPVVMLESTSADRHKLVNALNTEFAKRGFRVRQYQ